MMSWSVLRGWRDTNPCMHVKKLKGEQAIRPGMRTISIISKRMRASIFGMPPRSPLLRPASRRLLKMRWDDIEEGLIAVTQNKTNKKLWMPMHSQLAPCAQRHTACSVTIITNSRGTPWTVMGFKASWATELNRSHMQMLREKGRVFHGLRKSAVVFLLEAGCTDAEVAAVTGQSRKMVEHYSRQVNQQKLAARAILKWENGEFVRRTQNVETGLL